MRYIGIDPGGSGGIAVLGADGRVIAAVKMPETERDLLDVLRLHIAQTTDTAMTLGPARACLERVHAGPLMASRAAFTFGKGYGRLRMALVALDIPFDEPTPQSWQKALHCRTGGDKAVSKARAQELFSVKVTLWNSDALLLAEYCRRVQLGLAPPPPPIDPVAPRKGKGRWGMSGKGDAF